MVKKKVKEFEYVAEKHMKATVRIVDTEKIREQYDEFLESIRTEAVALGSIKVLISGGGADCIQHVRVDAFYSPRSKFRLPNAPPSNRIFKKRIKEKLDYKGRQVVEYWLQRDRGEEIGTVWGFGRAIIKADVILQPESSKDIADPTCNVEIVIRASIINWGKEQNNKNGRRRSTLILEFDKEECTLRQGGKVFESENTKEVSEGIAAFLSESEGEE